jgi:Ca2+-binding RTX toxin-like protein
MALVSITTDSAQEQYIRSYDVMYLKAGVSIVSANNGISSFGPNVFSTQMRIDGAVFGVKAGISLFGTYAGSVSTGLADHNVMIGATGTVDGGADMGIDMMGTGNTVVNYGGISALGSTGIGLRQNGDGASVQNFGSINGAFGISMYGDGGGSDIVNAGTISGLDAAITASGQSITLLNSGLITVATGRSGGDAITIANGSVSSSVIINTGSIFGSISGPLDQAIHITNTGTIIGDISMGGGSDVYDGRGGTLKGTLFGGDGDDTYFVDDATTNIVESLGNGTDTVIASVSYALGDSLENINLTGADDINATGNVLGNIINGNAGNNVLRAGLGRDNVSGGAGDDIVRGGAGNDRLKGGSGDDLLRGGAGNDNLKGGSGADVLIGGAGRDRLLGQDGSDVFRFNKALHSPDSGAGDEIGDFTRGEDVIDLSRLVPGTLEIIGSSGFSGIGQGEVRIIASGSDTIVRIDVDGDGSADMGILVAGVSTLNDLDFLL